MRNGSSSTLKIRQIEDKKVLAIGLAEGRTTDMRLHETGRDLNKRPTDACRLWRKLAGKQEINSQSSMMMR